MKAKNESVHTIYKGDDLVAIIKHDDITGKHIVYKATEMPSEEIAILVAGELDLSYKSGSPACIGKTCIPNGTEV